MNETVYLELRRRRGESLYAERYINDGMRFVLIAPAHIVMIWLQSVSYFIIACFDIVKRRRETANKQQSKPQEGSFVCTLRFSPFMANLLIQHEHSIGLDPIHCEAAFSSILTFFQFLANKFHRNFK